MTRNENATNEQYAYEIEGNIEITTYRKNLIEEIKEKLKDKKSDTHDAIQNFPAKSVTSEMLKEFADLAKKENVTIYKIVRI